jgi:hypothetical protein
MAVAIGMSLFPPNAVVSPFKSGSMHKVEDLPHYDSTISLAALEMG